LPLTEKALIRRIRKRVGTLPRSRGVLTGIGDDCAVLRTSPGRDLLVTTDFSLEGVHFQREWHPPEVVGHRCLARGLSDIAAMGGEPTAFFLSLALPGKLPQGWVDRFWKGMLRLADECQVSLAGGDTAESPVGVLADIVVLGSVPAGKAVLRSGAGPGDRIFLSGELGGSAAVLDMLRREPRRKFRPAEFPHHFFPQPRLKLGHILRERSLVSAMIDLSDGLSTDLSHICEESGVGAEIEAEAIPRATIGKTGHEVDLHIALHGGEDYELLFTAPRGKRIPGQIAGVPITQIGQVARGRRLFLMNGRGRSELLPQGWEHFKR
jgi:thiamine-monophosphate kinase